MNYRVKALLCDKRGEFEKSVDVEAESADQAEAKAREELGLGDCVYEETLSIVAIE